MAFSRRRESLQQQTSRRVLNEDMRGTEVRPGRERPRTLDRPYAFVTKVDSVDERCAGWRRHGRLRPAGGSPARTGRLRCVTHKLWGQRTELLALPRHKFDPVRDRATILRHPTRRQIARLCRSSARTISWLATNLDMEDGALRGTVKQMHEWGVLGPGVDSAPARRTFVLTPSWRPALADATRRAPPQDLLEGDWALLVRHPRASGADPDDLPPVAAWIIEFAQQRTALVGLVDGAPAGSAAAARTQLHREGASAELLRVRRRRAAASTATRRSRSA